MCFFTCMAVWVPIVLPRIQAVLESKGNGGFWRRGAHQRPRVDMNTESRDSRPEDAGAPGCAQPSPPRSSAKRNRGAMASTSPRAGAQPAGSHDPARWAHWAVDRGGAGADGFLDRSRVEAVRDDEPTSMAIADTALLVSASRVEARPPPRAQGAVFEQRSLTEAAHDDDGGPARSQAEGGQGEGGSAPRPAGGEARHYRGRGELAQV